MKPGDICWVSYPNLDGTETYDPRPVLLLVDGPRGQGQDEVVVIAQITADPDRVATPLVGDISLEDNYRGCGLAYPSVIRCRQLMSLPRYVLKSVAGSVPDVVLYEAQGIARELISAGELNLSW